MGLWRHHDEDESSSYGGVLGALFFMLGLYLIAELLASHGRSVKAAAQRAAERGEKPDQGLGWWTLGVLLALLAALTVLT